MTKTEIEKQIMAALSEKSYQPLKQKRLIRFLELEPDEDETAIEIISELLQKGSIVHLQKKGLALAQSVDLIAGTITFLRSGAAFVRTQDDQEYFIPGGNTGTAMPGDSVLISLSKRSSRRPRSGGDSPEGMVMSVSKRHSLTIVATIYKQNNSYFAEPFQSKISKHPEIDDIAGAKAGERVLVKLEDWDNPKMNPKGAIIEIIGPADNPALDTISVIKSHSLPEGFPPEVVEEAQAMTISESDLEERLDLRDNFIFTIDPETARDFDDAISLEEVDGKWKLGVHIADVSHYVAPGTELDKEAVKRATSVYLPDKVIPMLPEQLSNGLCSLSPGNDRLAFSIFLSLDNEGNVLGATFSKTVIHSKLRLSYEQAQLALESQKNSSFPQYDMDQKTVDLIKQVNHLAVKIRARRFKVDMSLNLNIPEVRFRINNEGRIETMLQEGSSESHQLIEECMLLANEYVCRELMDHKIPCIHRIHDEPDPEKLAELGDMFALAGIKTGDLSKRENMAALIQEITHPKSGEAYPQEHVWQSNILRSLKRAEYSEKCIGHYGLAKEFYCHFTSPIRRYPDLIVHRILFAYLHKKDLPYSGRDIAEIAQHCSQREQIATEAERDIIDLKKFRFFTEQLESGDLEEYDALVTGLKKHGLLIEIPDYQVYGMVLVSELQGDYYDYIPAKMCFKGRKTGTMIEIGTKMTVIIAKVNQSKRFLDFSPVKVEAAARGSKSQSNRGKSQSKNQQKGRSGNTNKSGSRRQKNPADRRNKSKRRKR